MFLAVGKNGSERYRLAKIWTEKWDADWYTDEQGVGIFVKCAAHSDGKILTAPQMPLRSGAFAWVQWHPKLGNKSPALLDKSFNRELKCFIPKNVNPEELEYHARILFGLFHLTLGRG